MADDNDKKDSGDAPKKSNKVLIIVGIVVILLLTTGLAVTGTLLFLSDKETEESAENAENQEEVIPPAPSPIFVKLEPFTVNLQGMSGTFRRNLLYVGMSFKVGNAETETFLTEHLLELKGRMINLMAAQEADYVSTPQGRDELIQQALQEAMRDYTEPQIPLEINGVFFNEFIVQ